MKVIRTLTGCCLRGVLWVLVLAMALPPWALGQGLDGLGRAAPESVSPQMIVTRPNALQPIVPRVVPCPKSGAGGGAPLPRSPELPRPKQGGEPWSPEVVSGSDTRDAGSGRAAPATGAMQRRQASSDPSASVEGPEGADARGAVAGPSHPELLDPVLQRLAGPSQPATAEDLSIEEAFARFFILQGVTGRLKQFGYNFFDVPFPGVPPVMDMPVGPDYVLGPEDTLALHVWNVPDPKFNRSYISPVERDGTLFIPHLGSIPVAGMTFSDATRIIKVNLSRLLKRFELHVSMARLRTITVYVVGEVVRPGAYEVSSLATASHALYAACGPSKMGSLRQIRVVRDGQTVAELDFYRFFLLGDRTQDIRLRSGDTLVVPPIGPVAAIAGPVKRPAIYELNGRTTLSELVSLAGGLAPTADRKRAQIFRVEAGRERIILDVELGDLLRDRRNGRRRAGADRAPSVDPLIRDGDFVRIASVPTQIEDVVFLAGAVVNPGPYAYRLEMRLADLLTPQDLLVDADLDRAELIRTDPLTYDVTIHTFSPKELFRGKAENVRLQRLDKVVIRTRVKPPRSVRVFGEVRRPGIYTIRTGETLSSVLERAGGFTDNAFPQGLILTRESVRQRQQDALHRFITAERQRLIAEAAGVAAGAAATLAKVSEGGQQPVLTLRLQQLESIVSRVELGRVVVNVESIERLRGTADDVILEASDTIRVPPPPQTVSVIGSVKNPTSLVHRAGLGMEDYLSLAGGPTEDASEGEIYLVRANGSTESGYLRVKEIQPGDTVVVPQKVEEKTPKLALWQSVASIVGSVALAAAGIAVIGR